MHYRPAQEKHTTLDVATSIEITFFFYTRTNVLEHLIVVIINNNCMLFLQLIHFDASIRCEVIFNVFLFKNTMNRSWGTNENGKLALSLRLCNKFSK